ncbi:MBL fold metallo-hydrolase [Celeribacter marinus]|uniref:MBL fold metallo-hydrolase n=1 Tax=Celeribacter marinus TaxID=1397108 RepID=UPI0007811B6C|nr:MBL fold metallo-hydrolase [Celeribacter marinus]SFK11545.1 Glyoxylase, beta-lactamase superfamily II [Celeribacter marinus]
MKTPIRTPVEPPVTGEAVEVSTGLLWARIPMPGPLEHVNVYMFYEGDSWTVVDTGIDTSRTRAVWGDLMAGPMGGKPVSRVIATHHHLDHIGLAGWFMAQHGATLVTTRTAYLMARMLKLDVQDAPTPQMLRFWRSSGMDAAIYAERETSRPFNTADAVADIPLGFTRIREGDEIEIGGRLWDVRCGNGHAPEHATFWSRDGEMVIGGDQLLASISPNIGVHTTEPDADPLGEWLESCERFKPFATDDQLILTGHKRIFTGLPTRLRQLTDNHHAALTRLLGFLEQPRTACDCFSVLFKREIKSGEYGLAMVEAMAHCNHLFAQGLVSRTMRGDGAYIWQKREMA